ncbi:MAG: GNAT family N-acetyltransferase [Clostridia bacterium]|nr:GNAT family N-acetyltransferase [Clostridia bacterium]
MLHALPLRDEAQNVFKKLFKDYYQELGCDEDCDHLLNEFILPDLIAGLFKIDMLKDGDEYVGFVAYQIDEMGGEWSFKEGWGDIREIYIAPSSRRKGYGKFLLYTAEMKLNESGAKKAYCLPCEGASSFFTACGYKKTDDYNDEVDCFFYEKHDLNNKCK